MARHYSPPGTYERIRKSVLEDPSLTNPEFRLALYLTTKPDRWVIHPRQLAAALDRTVNEIETALRGLRRRGLVTEEVTRTPGSGRRITSRQRRFRRDLVIAPDGQLLDGESAIQDLTCDDDKTAGRLLNGECAIQDLTCADDKTAGQVLDGTPLDSREPSPLERTHTQSDLWGTSPLDPPLGTGPQTAAGGTGSPQAPPVTGHRPPADRATGSTHSVVVDLSTARATADRDGSRGPDGPAPKGTGAVRADPAGDRLDGDRVPRERARTGARKAKPKRDGKASTSAARAAAVEKNRAYWAGLTKEERKAEMDRRMAGRARANSQAAQ